MRHEPRELDSAESEMLRTYNCFFILFTPWRLMKHFFENRIPLAILVKPKLKSFPIQSFLAQD